MDSVKMEDCMYCYHCMNQKGSAAVCPYCHKENNSLSSAHHLRPGTVLNHKYLVGYAIGEGGFGITYIGRDTTLDVRVAIKEFYPSGYSDRNSNKESTLTFSSDKKRAFFEKGKQRFLVEARSVAMFSSEKGIVDVRDYFEANGTAYIIMEYLDGIDLNQYLNTYGAMAVDKVFDLMLPVMRSLEKINAAGIIHRDISPDNIMYLRDGSLKLMDFGSARHFTNEEKEMSVMLKQGYAPEEQYRKNGNQGPWTDVYGMCATIYRCITGIVPEDGLDRIHEDTLKPPSELGVTISPALETVLMYGLAVFKENRCQNMTELIALVSKARMGDRVYIAPIGGTVLKSRTEDGAYKERIYGKTYGDSFSSDQKDEDKKDRGDDEDASRRDKKKKSIAPVVVSIIAVLLVVGIALMIIFRDQIFGKNDDQKDEPTVATEAVTEAPTEAPTEIPMVDVPDVTGEKLMDAKEIIEEAGLSWDVGTIESSMPPNYVVEQLPEAGDSVKEGTKVTLCIPDGIPTEEPTEEETEKETEKPDDDIYYSNAKYSVFLHKNPSRTSDFYFELPYGTDVKVLGLDGEFYKVRVNLFTGYVLSKYFSKSPDADYNYDEEYLRPMECTADIDLYSAPYVGADSFILVEGEQVTVVGYLNNEQYYEVVYEDTVYYLPKDDLSGSFRDSNT